MDFQFFLSSFLLGVGLAMDAFSVSLVSGMSEHCMKPPRMCFIAGLFAFFQALMPMLGWVCVHYLVQFFSVFEKFIPYIALALLLFIGVKMLIDGVKNKDCEQCDCKQLTLGALLVQGVATSIDALSVGFTVASYNWIEALVCALIIAAVTFAICIAGVFLGKKFGTRLSGKATLFGGVILIIIGIEIFITGIIG